MLEKEESLKKHWHQCVASGEDDEITFFNNFTLFFDTLLCKSVSFRGYSQREFLVLHKYSYSARSCKRLLHDRNMA